MGWTVEEVASLTHPRDAGVALDSTGKPHVVYLDATGGIWHAWKESGVWQSEQAATTTLAPVSQWIRNLSFAIGGDVMHLAWVEGGYSYNSGRPTTYPAAVTLQTALTVHHAYSTVGSNTWTAETVWTGPAD